MLWDEYKLENYTGDITFILDDNHDVFSSQKQNCIRAYPFFYSRAFSHQDDFLPFLQDELKQYISSSIDCDKINQTIQDKFKLDS